MATVSFASKLRADGSLAMPREAVDELGLLPGDEVQVQVGVANDINHVSDADQAALHAQFESFFDKLDTLTFRNQPSVRRSDSAEASFTDAMDEKYRKLGFK